MIISFLQGFAPRRSTSQRTGLQFCFTCTFVLEFHLIFSTKIFSCFISSHSKTRASPHLSLSWLGVTWGFTRAWFCWKLQKAWHTFSRKLEYNGFLDLRSGFAFLSPIIIVLFSSRWLRLLLLVYTLRSSLFDRSFLPPISQTTPAALY